MLLSIATISYIYKISASPTMDINSQIIKHLEKKLLRFLHPYDALGGLIYLSPYPKNMKNNPLKDENAKTAWLGFEPEQVETLYGSKCAFR